MNPSGFFHNGENIFCSSNPARPCEAHSLGVQRRIKCQCRKSERRLPHATVSRREVKWHVTTILPCDTTPHFGTRERRVCAHDPLNKWQDFRLQECLFTKATVRADIAFTKLSLRSNPNSRAWPCHRSHSQSRVVECLPPSQAPPRQTL